jgi:hypothetical protein
MVSDGQHPQFYVLLAGRGTEHDTEMLEEDPVFFGDAPRCESCGRFLGGRPWLAPHRAELALLGSTWGDLAFRVGDESDVLITKPVARSWKDERLTGLTGFEAVEITRVRGSQVAPPEYVHVSPEIGRGAIDERRSSLVRSEQIVCQRCHYAGTLWAINGFSLEPGTWTGADVFIPRGLSGTVVVTERFKDWVDWKRLTNVRLIPTESYQWDSRATASAPP